MGEFQSRYTPPEFSSHRVVMFPDRIHHGFRLNAEADPRYRYRIACVRSQSEVRVLLGYVYLDEVCLSSFLRLEYAGRKLGDQARFQGRRLGQSVRARMNLVGPISSQAVRADVILPACPDRLGGYHVELWNSLEPLPGSWHSAGVLDRMGYGAPITRVPAWSEAFPDYTTARAVTVTFEEVPLEPKQAILRDDNYRRSCQEPRVAVPNSQENTVEDLCYSLVFQNAFYFSDVREQVKPVTYRNAMMDPEINPDARPDNLIDMRWILQRELGGSAIFTHVVTIPPGGTEGVHLHVGSEEIYFFVAGEGLGYLGADDAPELSEYPTVVKYVQGVGPRPCKAVPVRPHSLIYSKSGGIHGVTNTGSTDLVFFAALQHTH